MDAVDQPGSLPPRSSSARTVIVGAVMLAITAALWIWWRGRPERHLGWAERLVERDPSAALAWLDLPEATEATRDRARVVRARVALARGRPGDAVGPLDAVDDEGPQAGEAAYWKGRTLYAVRQYLQALQWFQRAAALRPEDPDIHRWIAAAAYDLGARDLAFDALRTACRLEPDHAPTWRTLALMSKEQIEWEQARDAYQTTLELDANQPEVRLEFAAVLKELGSYEEAEAQLDACKRRVPEAERLGLLAECLYLRGDRDRLPSLLEEALASHPQHAGLLALRGMLLLAEGHPEAALANLDPALAAEPTETSWQYQRGLALQRLGRSDEARLAMEQVEERKRDLARLADLESVAARDLDDAGVRVRIAELCTRLGRIEMAESWYRSALACDPENPEARAATGAR